jgi:hypothetical protein
MQAHSRHVCAGISSWQAKDEYMCSTDLSNVVYSKNEVDVQQHLPLPMALAPGSYSSQSLQRDSHLQSS